MTVNVLVGFVLACFRQQKTLAINENIKKIVELSDVPPALRGLCLDVALFKATNDDFCIRHETNGAHLAAVWRFLSNSNDSDSFKVVDDRVVCTVNEWRRYHSVKAIASVSAALTKFGRFAKLSWLTTCVFCVGRAIGVASSYRWTAAVFRVAGSAVQKQQGAGS